MIAEDIKNKDVGDQSFGFNSDAVLWLKQHNYNTIRDVIAHQKDIPNKYLTPIKAKLIFGIDVK